MSFERESDELSFLLFVGVVPHQVFFTFAMRDNNLRKRHDDHLSASSCIKQERERGAGGGRLER